MVAILLHPRDCAERVEALAAWNRIHRSGQVRVVGLVAEETGVLGELARISKGAGLDFPLHYVDARDLRQSLHSLNHRATPVAVLLDRDDRVRLAIPLDEVRPREIEAFVAAYIPRLSPPAGPLPE